MIVWSLYNRSIFNVLIHKLVMKQFAEVKAKQSFLDSLQLPTPQTGNRRYCSGYHLYPTIRGDPQIRLLLGVD